MEGIEKIRDLALKAAKQAGKVLLKHYGKVKSIKAKDNLSYVSNVDLESEKCIISAIRKTYPEHDIISEESGRLNKKSDYIWHIDPLDGTHNYINNIPLFGVSIALEYKGKIILGVINLPYFNELYFAEKGKGAFLNGKHIKVSNKKDLKKSFIAVDLVLRHNPEKKIKFLKKLEGHVHDLRVLGSAVAAVAYVARGSADLYLVQQTNSWDISAGFLLIEEAGGKVTGFNGNNWNPYMDNFIASNKILHNGILKVFNKN